MKFPNATKKLLRYTFSALYTAGTLYWIGQSFLRKQGPYGEERGVLEKYAGPLHLIFAFLFLFTMGMVWTQHIVPSLRREKKSLTGWIFVVLIGVLLISGIGLNYGGDTLLPLLKQLHPYAGLALLPTLAVHWNFAEAWSKLKSVSHLETTQA